MVLPNLSTPLFARLLGIHIKLCSETHFRQGCISHHPLQSRGCFGDPGLWSLQHSSSSGGLWLFIGIEEPICVVVLWGDLNPSWCPSLAVGVETPRLEGLAAPPAAAGADWLIFGLGLQFQLCPSQM